MINKVDYGWSGLIKVHYDDDFINDSDLVGVGARNFIIIIMVFDRVFFLMMMMTMITVDCSDAWCIPPRAGGA